MRRSSKFALFSAFGIALLAAQTSPYANRLAGRNKVEQLRTERADVLILKLDMVKEDKMRVAGLLRWLLALVSSSDTRQFYVRNLGAHAGKG